MYIYYTKNPLKSIKQTTISQNNHFKVASTKLEHRKPLNNLERKFSTNNGCWKLYKYKQNSSFKSVGRLHKIYSIQLITDNR